MDDNQKPVFTGFHSNVHIIFNPTPYYMEKLTTYLISANKVSADLLKAHNARTAGIHLSYETKQMSAKEALALFDQQTFVQGSPSFVTGMRFKVKGFTVLKVTPSKDYKGTIKNPLRPYLIINLINDDSTIGEEKLVPYDALAYVIPESPFWSSTDPDVDVNELVKEFLNRSDLKIKATDTADVRLGAIMDKSFEVREARRITYKGRTDTVLYSTLLDLKLIA